MWQSVFQIENYNGVENIYTLAWAFLIFSFLGWCVESLYMSLCNRKVTNRGFIKAPICPIYGMGEFLVHLILLPFAGNYVILYFAGAVLATAFEFTVANLMIHTLGFVWWDYTNKPFNYRGIICLESSLAWGVYSIVDFAFLHDFVVHEVVARIPYFLGRMLAPALILFLVVSVILRGRAVLQGEVEIVENNLMAVNTGDSPEQSLDMPSKY